MATGLIKAYLMHYDRDAHISKMYEHGMMHTPIDLQRHAQKHAPINAITRFTLYARSNGPIPNPYLTGTRSHIYSTRNRLTQSLFN